MFPEKSDGIMKEEIVWKIKRKNELAVVIAATVVFGFMNRILIRIPYMVLGDFSFSFLISVVTWWIYNSVLFSVAEQMQMGDGGKKRIGK